MKITFNRLTLVACTATFITLLALRAEGQAVVIGPSPATLQIGSVAAVSDHAAQSTDHFWLDIYQVRSDGSIVFFAEPTDHRSFSNMQELTAWLCTQTAKYATNILSSTNALLDQQFVAYATAMDYTDGYYGSAYCNHPFYLTYSNGQYRLPSFSGLTWTLCDLMPYRFPGINWAVTEIYNQQKLLIDMRDSRFYPDPYSGGDVDSDHQLLILPTAYITGQYPLRLIVTSGTNYDVYGENGTKIPEILPTTDSLSVTNGMSRIHISPGEVGRVLTLQASTNLVTWNDVTGGYVAYYTGVDQGFWYSEPDTYISRYYRVKAQ